MVNSMKGEGSPAFQPGVLPRMPLAFSQTPMQFAQIRPEDDTYACSYPGCGMSGMSLYKFQRHVRLHTGERFECETCGQKFLDKGVLKRHQDVHTGEFKCKWCSKIFRSKTGLNVHQKSHPESKFGWPKASPKTVEDAASLEWPGELRELSTASAKICIGIAKHIFATI